jgi:predicted AlkP superfamily pyrophosphatase or phosphodiesterase
MALCRLGTTSLISAETPQPSQRHVVMVVWDGMRPDFVTEQFTPTLWKLAQDGVVFTDQHPVYFSATNVNGVALATGMYPSHSDLIANHEFRPEINNRQPVDVENPAVVRKGDELSHGGYIAAPTVAELVQKAGGRTVIAASKTVGLLHDRPRPAGFGNGSVTLSAGMTWPNEAGSEIIKVLGPFPKSYVDRDNWTTKALTEVLWKDAVPPFTVLWLGQPDLTQHEKAPGSPEAIQGIRSSDTNLAALLNALDRRNVRDSTDIFVVSDHGFSTIQRSIELPRILAEAGFNVTTEFKTEPQSGDIMVVGGGGSVLFYVVQHEPSVVNRLIDFLQHSDFAAVIFAREQTEGAFTLAQAQIDSPDAPDVVMAFQWNDRPNKYGTPGMITADWQRGPGGGTHASLSRFDMHNTLVAAGPDFRRGQTDKLPTGNIDVAPTILKILHISDPARQDGRVLTEAMSNSSAEPPPPESHTIEASRQFPNGWWRQTLRFSRVGTTIYLDEGHGGFEPTEKQR